ncbi:hypothetical protein C9994_10505 [Marivirga lumbricoides]|uniref:DNA polymerase III subunit psi n=1 Tax=Marivirga lumbricoides TaxID=1046115 RepID=A0A2T4DPI9_9BACT|nr:hypothetical protein C9994_10505 [Marivirga lumbricoides]
MKIDQEYLPLIFETDIIYVTEEANSSVAADVEKFPAINNTPPKAEKPIEVVNEAPQAYTSTSSVIEVMIDDNFSDNDKVLLGNILKALNTDLSEVTILREHPEDFKNTNASLFLCFDDNLVKSSQYELNQVFKTKVIYSHSLSTLDKNKTLKMSLWKLLKEF